MRFEERERERLAPLSFVATTPLVQTSKEGNIHKNKLAERFQAFAEGQWSSLLRQSREYAEEASVVQHRKRSRCNPQQDLDRRAACAEGLVQMGELSAGRQLWKVSVLRLGAAGRWTPNHETRSQFPHYIWNQRCHSSSTKQVRRECSIRETQSRSWTLTRLVLDNGRDVHLLYSMPEQLARGRISPPIADALRLRRMIALQKANGGVRGIVVRDILRRLVARTVAQQMGKVVEAVTRPHQYAMSTRAGTKCIAHVDGVKSSFDSGLHDGVGAHDSISRKAMLEALARLRGGSQVLPFARLFYGRPSQYLWEDSEGVVYRIAQGEAARPCCSPLDNMRHWKQSKPGWWKERCSWRFSMTRTSSPHWRESAPGSTVAKRRCGTQLRSALKHATHWSGSRRRKTQVRESGRDLTSPSPPGNKESAFWELHWGTSTRGGTVDEEVRRTQRVLPTHPPVG